MCGTTTKERPKKERWLHRHCVLQRVLRGPTCKERRACCCCCCCCPRRSPGSPPGWALAPPSLTHTADCQAGKGFQAHLVPGLPASLQVGLWASQDDGWRREGGRWTPRLEAPPPLLKPPLPRLHPPSWPPCLALWTLFRGLHLRLRPRPPLERPSWRPPMGTLSLSAPHPPQPTRHPWLLQACSWLAQW